MEPKSAWADELLRRVRASADPKPSNAARVLAGIERQIGGAGAVRTPVENVSEPAAHGRAGGELQRQGSPTGAKPWWSRVMWGAGFGLAMGGLGYWLGWQSHAAQMDRVRAPSRSLEVESPAPALVASSGVPEVAPSPLGVASPPPEVVSSPAVSGSPSPRVARSQPVKPARQRAARAGIGKPADAQAEGITLRDAIDQLQRAQLALRRGEPRAALALVLDLDSRSPVEMLREERLTTRALALCELGERERARQLFGELRDTEAQSIYGPRLEESCGLELDKIRED